MKTKLLLLTFLLPTFMFAQVGNGFENTPGVTFNASGGSCQYFDFDTATVHTLANYNAPCGLIYVTEPSSGATLGYTITLDPTSPNGPAGFSDGDFFGVGTSAFFNIEIGLNPPEGSQGFFMEDPDGNITMTFDIVDLTGATNPQFNMQYVLEGTSWELEDFLKITIQFTDCGSPTLTLIDTTGLDIDNLGIEDTWNTLNADLTANVGCKAQLIIEFSSNSAAEELGLDAIAFTGGMTLSAETIDLDNSISIFPNPSKGIFTIKNNGTSLETVQISDINGRTISKIDMKGITTDKSIDLTSALSGVYFVTITSGNESVTKKLIIE
ncbi:T9SS type A sorting domain-containing protein [Psychroserpens sp. AS72]|uniref:T9SS type A sorting domain-containing protein n=1 Tax=Psychroserpens sp. AS72 TaxID=3135775 RepID=UPI00317D3688